MDSFPCVFGDFANLQRQQGRVGLSYRGLHGCVGPHNSRITEHVVQTHFVRKFVHFSTYNFSVEYGVVQQPNLFVCDPKCLKLTLQSNHRILYRSASILSHETHIFLCIFRVRNNCKPRPRSTFPFTFRY